jgi:hypothetical protein
VCGIVPSEKAQEILMKGIVASLGEAETHIQEQNIGFPILIIPWDAERSGKLCHVVQTIGQFRRKVPQALVDSSYAAQKRVHIISKQDQGPFWTVEKSFVIAGLN